MIVADPGPPGKGWNCLLGVQLDKGFRIAALPPIPSRVTCEGMGYHCTANFSLHVNLLVLRRVLSGEIGLWQP